MATSSSKTKITRIKASDAGNKKTPEKTATVTRVKATDTPAKLSEKPEKQKEAKPKQSEKKQSVFSALASYFKGSWKELRQVRWPDRKATWGMTGALIAFTAFFAVLILLLDALFKYLFQLIIK